MEKSEKNLTTREKCEGEECAGPKSRGGLAGALGRGLGTKDVPLKNVRAVFRQSHGGTSDLHRVKILILIRRQGRIQVGHQRGDSYLITKGIGGSEEVTNGFVYEVGAGTNDNQSPCSAAGARFDFDSPAYSRLQIRRALMAALPHFVVTEPAADVGQLDSLCSVGVVVGV